MNKLNRNEVYELINTERDYQDSLGSDRRESDEAHTVGEYLTMLRVYANKADSAWTDNPGNVAALDVIRKIAGIAVHCMEENGAPPRKL